MLRFFESISKWRGKPELETVSPPLSLPCLFFAPPTSFLSCISHYCSIFVVASRLVWTN